MPRVIKAPEQKSNKITFTIETQNFRNVIAIIKASKQKFESTLKTYVQLFYFTI